jgi:tetratricopeptide (TPR) repeat protein
MAFKGRNLPVPEIARELKVDGVLEASVLKVGSRTRIQAQLIGAFPEEHHIWAQSFDRDLSDILAMHSEVAEAVAREVQVELSPGEGERLADTRQVAPETYELYLKGMFHLNKFTPEGFEAGLGYLNQAVENDPTEPLPYAALGLAWAIIGHTPSPPPDSLPRAKDYALKALELDETLAEAHTALAEVKIYYDWDVEGAGREYRRALELNPNLPETRAHYAWYKGLLGTMEDGFDDLLVARSQDPLNPAFSAWLAWMYDWAEHYQNALKEAQKSLELNPEFPIANYALGVALTGLGKFDDAIAAHRKAGAASPMWGWGLGCTYAAMGEKERALAVAGELEENLTNWDSWGIAEIYAALKDAEGTLRWLEEALERKHSYIPWLNRVPWFAFLRDDPRFQDIARRGNAPA